VTASPAHSLSPAEARRNVLVSSAASFLGFAGFTLVMPFLPMYISELGVRDVGEIALWSGLTLGATPAVTAISAPLWGRVGDRYGSKVLVIRSLAAFVLTKGAMAFVTAPWQLVALRGLLGVFAGYGALTLAMAAESTPRDQMPRAIGAVQVGQRLGPAVGPLLGGLLAPVVGLRRTFLVTAAVYLVALVLVARFYREPRERRERPASRGVLAVARELTATRGFLLALVVIFVLQTVDRSFSPILPLVVEQLGLPSNRVAIVSGALFSILAVGAAAGHRAAGPLMRRWSAWRIVVAAAFATAAALIPLLAAPSLWTLAGALVAASAGIGVASTTVYSVAASLLPRDAHVTGFGVMTTASLVGLAVSPVLAGLVGTASLHVVFVVDAVLLVVLAMMVIAGRRARV
jgi:MFS family permease